MPNSSYRKDPWRDRNIEFCTERVTKFSPDGKLPCSYLELLGLSGIDSYNRMKPLLRDPSHFIGVDKDLKVLASYRGLSDPNDPSDPCRARPEFMVIYRTNAYSWAVELARSSRFELPIGVFNFDDTIQAGNDGKDGWGTNLELIASCIAPNTTKRLGFCSIFINASFGRFDPRDHRDILIKHAGMIVNSLRRYKWKVPDVRSIIGSNAELQQLESPSHTGNVGFFDIYTSKQRTLRMATIRLHFSGNIVAPHKSPSHLYCS